MPSDAFVHSVNNLVALPSRQHDLPNVPQSVCSVPVPVICGVPVYTFSPLSPVSEVSPLRWDQVQLELRHHPHRSAVAYVISGIQEGFRIGFEASSVSLKYASSNMHSSSEHPSVIDSYLQSEVSSHRVAGPFSAPPFPSLLSLMWPHLQECGNPPRGSPPSRDEVVWVIFCGYGASIRGQRRLFSPPLPTWLTHNYGVNFLRHYLDDILTLGPPSSSISHNNLQTGVQLCEKLGLPFHPYKLEGPATCLTILGIELDTFIASQQIKGTGLLHC